MCITFKVVMELRNVYHTESCYKVAKCIYHHVCITRKVVINLRMYISSSVHHNESCGKNAEYIHHHVSVTGKVVIKLRNVDIITCASQGKLFSSRGMYVSLRVHHKESCSQVAECISLQVCITMKVVVKMQYIFIITSPSQGKLLQSCGMLISLRVHHKESCSQVAECISLQVCMTKRVLVKLQNVYTITCAS